ncbi:MAG: hypothetical protein ACRD0N_15815 [Acidimicrobiales bacterium]
MSATVTPADHHGSGFVRFWTTMPGLLTAVAAVVTAVTGFVALRESSDKPATNPEPPSASTTLPASPLPDEPITLVPDDFNLAPLDALQQDDQDALEAAMVACGNGEMDACVAILDGLAEECAAGAGISCDLLFELSPSGSDYEFYGMTCGGRIDPAFAPDDCASA